jgi:transposase
VTPYSTKRNISWVGYKVHLTETCDAEMPRIITNVETTPASAPDDNMLAVVHHSLGRARYVVEIALAAALL